jgi:hypothetical protein
MYLLKNSAIDLLEFIMQRANNNYKLISEEELILSNQSQNREEVEVCIFVQLSIYY